ncbi:MAG: glycosyl transferase [Chitinophagaceae bacterium]|nr:glycosyl transferase [Chitinophagaceae bacterium]
MKILYAIQGTGNGHVARAREIVPILQKHYEVDVLISGTQAEVELPFEVKYRYEGLSFIFGKQGGIDLFETYKRSHLRVLLNEINHLPVQDYDLVINDFEPVSAWACYQKGKLCIGVSHQAAVLNKKAPVPAKNDLLGRAILKKYAPVQYKYGFHFKAYDENIYTPVIRKQVREMPVTNEGHYTVYLPAYSDERIIKVLAACKDVKWQVFSKHNKIKISSKNIEICPINNDDFIASMASCKGVLCGAGFETPAEALFFKKKLLVIPMKGQYEQQCNAAALQEMGIPVIKSLKKKHLETIIHWIENDATIHVDYPDETESIFLRIIQKHSSQLTPLLQAGKKVYTAKKFRKETLKKIVSNV